MIRLRPPASLQGRLLLAAAGVTLVALVLAGLAIGIVLERFVRGQIDGRLDAVIVALEAALRQDGAGHLILERDIDAPPFDRPSSGWAWEVRRGSDILRSPSLAGGRIEIEKPPPGDLTDEPRPGEGRGPEGQRLVLRMVRTAGPGGGAPVLIVASAPSLELQAPIRDVLVALALILAALGGALAFGAVLQVRLGLRPLGRLRDEVEAVRTGRARRLGVAQADEVRPLSLELNALLAQNEAQLEAARAHLANLAHGLKTPLATLAVALRGHDPGGDLGRLVAGMDRSVAHHLRRARSAALAGPVRSRVALAPKLADLRDAMVLLHADRSPAIHLAIDPSLEAACDPQDLDEMLGNLLDNACRWCRTAVEVSASRRDAWLRVTIDDDGPGIDEPGLAATLRRGERLDESVPGHGFGLPITRELAELYGGGLAFDRSPAGGLRVELTLPK